MSLGARHAVCVSAALVSPAKVMRCIQCSLVITCFWLSDVPSAPTNLRASQVSGDSVTLDWSKSRSDGGSPLTGYVIERRDATSNYWTRVGSVDHRKTSFVVTNLRPGAEYQLQVLAENDVGVSDPCTLSAPLRLPAAPAARMLTFFSSAGITVHFRCPVIDSDNILLVFYRSVLV